jgi:transcriptional regulator with XRE-family HTH domain
MPDEESFPTWFRQIIGEHGYSQEGASRALGMSVKTIQRWLNGSREPDYRSLRKIREVFGETPPDLK